MKKLHIIADGSIIAIANTAKYNETLKFQKNWTWKQFNDLMLNTNKDNLIVFNTTWDEEWIITYLINEETDKPYFRKFEQSIVVTHGVLHLVDWGDLTSTLQFDHTTLPSSFNQELKIEMENGFYKVVVKQLFDLTDNYDPGKVNFIIEFSYNKQIQLCKPKSSCGLKISQMTTVPFYNLNNELTKQNDKSVKYCHPKIAFKIVGFVLVNGILSF